MKQQKEVGLFYKRIREQARLRGESLNSVERKLGYPRNALNNYKNVHSPSAKRLVDLSQYFDVAPEYLTGEKIPPLPLTPSSYFERLTDQEKSQMFILSQTWMIEALRKIL